MKREHALRERLRSFQTLREAVGAMKSLSAHHFRETRAAVEPARIYRAGVESILARTGASLRAGPGPAGLLVVGAELGLSGGYNARVVALGAERRAELGAGPTSSVGRRATALLGKRGIALRKSYAAPTSVRGIPELLLGLAEDVLTSYVEEQLSSFDIVSSRFGGIGAERPVSTRILPMDTAPSAALPKIDYVPREHVLTAALREFLYITLHDVLLDALAAEHSARLAATQSAERWLDERTDRLRRHLAATRREASTQEVIEIAAGARR